MKKRVKYDLINKQTRLLYIKTERAQLVRKVFLDSFRVNDYLKIANHVDSVHFEATKHSRSNFRLYCMLNHSPKIVNKKFKLGRFMFNYLADRGQIGGLYKRGW